MSMFRPVAAIGISLATIGVVVSTVVMALIGRYVLGLDWTLAILLGAVFAPTDAAAVFSMLRRVPLRPRLSGALEAESGLNDAPTVVLVTLVSMGEIAGLGVGGVVLVVVYELIAGSAIGYVVGRLGAAVLRRAALPASGLYPLVVMTLCVLSYATGAAAHASGFAAVYVTALILGNSALPHPAATRSFAEGLAWMSQIGLFVMLGLLASPSRMPEAVLPALVAGICLTPRPPPVRARLDGAVPAVQGRTRVLVLGRTARGDPGRAGDDSLAERVDGAAWLFAVVFVVTVVFTVLQGPTLPWLAGALGVGGDAQAQDTDVESAPLDRLHADLVRVRVPARSRLHGVEVGELRLPKDVSVALVVRGVHSFVPDDRTKLRHGDENIVAPRRLREATEERIRASRSGRLAGWFGERGKPDRDGTPFRRNARESDD